MANRAQREKGYRLARIARNPNYERDNAKLYRQRNPERIRANRRRLTYGITPEAWEALFNRQGKSCAICKAKEPGNPKGWHTDHCHESSRVRGILCHHCNVLLGNAKESSSTLVAALNYLGDNMQLAFDASTVAPAVGGSTFFPLGNYPVEIVRTEGKQVNGSTDKGYLELTLKTLGPVEGIPAGTEHSMRLNIFNDSEAAVRIAYATLSAIMHVTGRKVIQDTNQLVGAQFLAKIGPQIKDGQNSDKYSEVKLVMDFNGNTADKIGQPAQTAQVPAQTVAQQPATPPAAPQQPWQGQAAATSQTPPPYVNGSAMPAAQASAPWLK